MLIIDHSLTIGMPLSDRNLRCTVVSLCVLPFRLVDTVCTLFSQQRETDYDHVVPLVSDGCIDMEIVASSIDDISSHVRHALKLVLS